MYSFLSLRRSEILTNAFITLRSRGWIFFGHLLAPHRLSGAKMGNCVLQGVLQQFGRKDFKPLPEGAFCWEQYSPDDVQLLTAKIRIMKNK